MSRIPAADTRSMAQVRHAVDCIDRELVALLAERMTYMEAAARIKPERGQVRDEARKAQVIANARANAANHGLDADFAAEMWEQLVEASIAHELTVWDGLREPVR